MNKKGMVEVVSIMIIILMVISAISLFFAGYVKNSAINLSPQISCTELRISQPVKIESVCFNSQSGEVKISIHRSLDSSSLNSIKFSLTQDNINEEWECGSTCGTCKILSSGSTATYYLREFNAITAPENLIISLDGCITESKQLIACNNEL